MPPNDPASPPRRPLPQPVETGHKARRRFAPEPIEQTTRSSRKGQDGATAGEDAGEQLHDDTQATSRHRTLPQPVESSKTSSRARKFAPQLIETARRSRKRTDTLPAVLPSDRAEEYQPHELLHIPKHLRPSPTPPLNSPIASTERVPQLHESRFSAANLANRVDRRHSFRVPELPRIASSGSEEESNCPALSASPSARSEEPEPYKHATRIRESIEDRSSGYLLSLAARTAEKQLREQVLAAYPNEHDYEPVSHFAVDPDSDVSDPDDGHVRSSQGDRWKAMPHKRDSDAGWDVGQARQQRDQIRQQQKDHKGTRGAELDRRKFGRGPFADADVTALYAKAAQGEAKGADKQEWREMRKAASPPMAGGDLRFPKCRSPRQTRLDVSSYPISARFVRPTSPAEHSGLWTPGGGASRQGSTSGLWMGVCAASAQEELAPPKMLQSGLLTPGAERDDPFAQAPESHQNLPPSPPNSFEGKAGGIDDILRREQTIEEEFGDTFVTQVYNYLSLGYPSLASKFDIELSKITKVPVERLRRDDCNANAKGYIGAPEGTGSDIRGMQDGQCERWIALRLYVREWARQHPHMISRNDGANKEWGARARKGSWAL